MLSERKKKLGDISRQMDDYYREYDPEYLQYTKGRGDGLYAIGGEGKGGFGDWLVAVKENDKEKLAEFKTLQVGLGSAGGFLVPVQFQARLLAIPGENAIVRPRALVLPVEGETIQIPSLDQTGDPGVGKTNRFGGVRLHWTEEGAAKEETEPAFKLVTLKLHELSGFTYVTDRLLRANALALETFLYKLFGDAIVDETDYNYIQGNGAGVPQGIISAPCTIQPNRAGAGHIIYADVIEMYHAFLHSPRGVWLINPCCLPDMLELKNPTTNEYIWTITTSGALPTTLLNYPIIWTDKASALGVKGDIILADFSYYVIGEGNQVSVEASPHYKWIENTTTFRFHILVDGTPWLSAPLYTRGGDYQVSPFVALDVPA